MEIITNISELLHYKEKILKLFHQCFQRRLAPEIWDWAYIKNPLGNPIVCLSMDKEFNIVGHYAIIPFQLVDNNNKPIKAGLSMTTMVHPDFRISDESIVVLANSVYEEARKQNYDFIFGFPNQTSSPVFRILLGWDIDKSSQIVRFSGEYLNNSGILKLLSNAHFSVAIHNKEFMDWRLAKPDGNYILENNIIAKSYDGAMDLLYFTNETRVANDVDYNLIVNASYDLGDVKGEVYHFGVRAISKKITVKEVSLQMINSDVF